MERGQILTWLMVNITIILFGIDEEVFVAETFAGKLYQSVGDDGSFGPFHYFAFAGG